ncbi:MAG: hypothetical protein ACRDJN_12415, partial [Chloroflexota bacterium]
MMLRADGLGRVFGFRRKKTLADRVQDVADDLLDVVDKAAMSAREAYVTTLASATPVLAKSSKTAGKTAGKAIAESSKTAGKTAGRVRLLSGRAADKADKAADRARDAYESTVEAAGPLLARSSRT